LERAGRLSTPQSGRPKTRKPCFERSLGVSHAGEKNMAWEKPTAQTIALFESLVPQHETIGRRKMVRFPVAFATGNMFIGLHENRMILRLDKPERERFITGFG